MCSFAHPAISQPEGGGPARKFRSLKELRRTLESEQGLHFCAICLAGRKVGGACLMWEMFYCHPEVHTNLHLDALRTLHNHGRPINLRALVIVILWIYCQ